MRVLAVDPGLTRCGVGVVDGVPGRKLTLVEVGVIRTPPGDPTPKRLVALEDEMRLWFERHRPESVAIERVFADTNVSTVMGTAQVTGIVMMIAERRGLPVTLHTPTEVKAAVSGSGRADKAQVTTMVTRLLGLDTAPKPADAADALALAICHVWRGGTQTRLAEAAAAHGGRPSTIPTRVPRVAAGAAAPRTTARRATATRRPASPAAVLPPSPPTTRGVTDR
ncbi:MAG: crossover junction endodeoxyribonuclease RuvC [Terracoccus sp.]